MDTPTLCCNSGGRAHPNSETCFSGILGKLTNIMHAQGDHDIAQELIRAGAEVNTQAEDGTSCMHLACAAGRDHMIEVGRAMKRFPSKR